MKAHLSRLGSLGLGGLLIVLSGCQVGDGTVGAVSGPIVSQPSGPSVEVSRAPASCAWWGGLSQADRNQRIVLEALYAVDRQIWDQNERCTCSWSSYLAGTWGCRVPGDWDYARLGDGVGGPCKEFARTVIKRASGDNVNLPVGYDYRGSFPWRNRQDAINVSQPGELIQFTGSVLHTVLIVTNFHDGRFEVVDSNSRWDGKINKHVIKVTSGDYATADMKAYVIDCP